MEISLREAAVLMGVSPRTLRAKAQRGELPATKVGRVWRFDHRHLPLTAEQRDRMQSRAQEVRDAVEAVLPSRMAQTRSRSARSLADLDAFRLGAEALTEARAADVPELARQALECALLRVAEASFVYDRGLKLELLNRARVALGEAVARLLLEESAASRDLAHRLERWRAELADWLHNERGLRLKHPRAPVLTTRGTLNLLGMHIEHGGLVPRPAAISKLQGRVADAVLGRSRVDMRAALGASAGLCMTAAGTDRAGAEVRDP